MCAINIKPTYLRSKMGEELNSKLVTIIEKAAIELRKNCIELDSIENGIEHANKVEHIIARLIPESDDDYWSRKDAPSPFELYMLLSAVYLHDINKCDGKENHEFRAADNVTSSTKSFGFSNNETRIIADIIRAHADETAIKIHDLKTEDGDGLNQVNVQFLGAVLRLADELDCDYKRVEGIEHLRKSIRESIQYEYIQSRKWLIKIGTEAKTYRDKVKLELLEKKSNRILRTVRETLHSRGLYYHNIEVNISEKIEEPPCEIYYNGSTERFDINNAVNDHCGNILPSKGLCTRDMVYSREKIMEDEVIRVLFMEKPITLQRELQIIKNDSRYGLRDMRKLYIDLADVKYAAYNNAGRNGITYRFFNENTQLNYSTLVVKKWAETLDKKLHDFILEDDPNKDFIKFELPMRWCSGGVFPVVSYKEKLYGMFFFRDIKPFGWQVPIGGSETTEEIAFPERMMWREFCEEFLVLKEKPCVGKEIICKRPKFEGSKFIVKGGIKEAEGFSKDHIDYRNNTEYDNLKLGYNKFEKIEFKKLKFDCCIDIDGENLLKNTLFTINPFELGIETIAVIEIQLNDEDYLLDGEIIKPKNELARMPVVLISLDYLERNSVKKNAPFRSLDYVYDCGSDIPSIKGLPYEEGDVVVFAWDIIKRKLILDNIEEGVVNEEGQKTEYNRYSGNWQKLGFANMFETDDLISKPTNIPTLFTANAAKIACYYTNLIKNKR